ncbi:MAG: flagellar motor protein MotB [candidate division Zixibacteria bacterium]
MADSEQPIIIKKIKKSHAGHHGGSWKVALADFMTAMMAFFLVMWLVGQSPEVKENVSEYFRDPGKYNQRGRSGVLKGTKSILKSDAKTVSMVKTPKSQTERMPAEEEAIRMRLTAKKIFDELKKQKEFERLKKNIKLQMTSEGLRIVLNESENSPAFFEPGSDKLLQKSAAILVAIAREVGQLKNRVVIEGHTDGAYSGRTGYSNWELSADRANVARQLMAVSGLDENQVREVRGYANQFPMIVGDPNDPRNRRISILLLYEERSFGLDQIEVGEDLMSSLE